MGESSPMLPKSKGDDYVMTKTFNIETLRCTGYFFLLAMIMSGQIVTNYFPNWPDNPDGTPGTIENAFIVKLFHFPHSCVYIDYHPAKMIAAIVCQGFFYPFVAYLILGYYRTIHSHKLGEINDALLTYTKITTPINLAGTILFVLAFVNGPDDKNRWFFGASEEYAAFWWHYIPFSFYQLVLVLVSIEQVWYLSLKNKMPFGISAKAGWYYLICLCIVFVYYTVFVVSFLMNRPILDTTDKDGWQNFFAGTIVLWGFNVLAIIFPFICGLQERKNGLVNTIAFY